jgi:hypothetical protein
MTRNKTALKSPAPARLSVAWPPFTEKLAQALSRLEEDQFLIISVKNSNRYVQFSAQGSFGMRAETTSNSYLAKPEKLNKQQIAVLIDAGWNDPTGGPKGSTPEKDPDGSPNFFVDFPAPVSLTAVAKLAVQTFSEILRVPHPGSLQYEAFGERNRPFTIPDLGLKLASSARDRDAQKDLPQLLLKTLEGHTNLTGLDYDEDGDITVRFGSAVVFIRLGADPPCVRFYSRLLRGVDEGDSASIYARLNDMNGSEPLTRFILRGDSIYAISDICTAPFIANHVIQAFVHFSEIAASMDCVLQAEFGGQTAFGDPITSSLRH